MRWDGVMTTFCTSHQEVLPCISTDIREIKCVLRVCHKKIRCRPGGLASEDELWQELGTLRRRATEQEAQIDRQEQIILGLQQRLAAAPSGPGSAGSERAGLRPGSSGQGGGGPPSRGGERGGGGPGGGGDAQAMEQQLKLVEVENGRLQELVRLLQAKLEAALDS